MDQQTQSSPPVQPVEQVPIGQQPQKSSSKVWLWVLGGCLTVIIIAGIIMGGLAWWGAKKVKKAIQENQPKWEEVQKGAQEMQKQSEDWEKASKELQEQMEKAQKELPGSTSN